MASNSAGLIFPHRNTSHGYLDVIIALGRLQIQGGLYECDAQSGSEATR